MVLASGSASRLRVLTDAGIDPDVVVSGVDEDIDVADTPTAVLLLAERKAAAVAPRCGDALVLGCDSMLDVGGQGYSKPETIEAALAGWGRIAGAEAVLCTGHCLIDGATGRRASAVAQTVIQFARPTAAELAAYMGTGEPFAAAGGFTIEGFGAPFVERIAGDPSNVLGLSMPLLRMMLAELGVPITDLWRRDSNR